MTLRRFIIALGIAGMLLVWLFGRRNRDIEYPAQPEPPRDWWNITQTPLTMADIEDYYNTLS